MPLLFKVEGEKDDEGSNTNDQSVKNELPQKKWIRCCGTMISRFCEG
jgi:hypothetical protein